MKTYRIAVAARGKRRAHGAAVCGFSLVEVMVALMVLAVGMLGIASLYTTTLRSSSSALSRMQAVSLASDLADRIRANRNARGTYATNPAAVDCTGSDNCTAASMVAHDLSVWQSQIDAILGTDAQGFVVYTAGSATVPDNYAITINWTERSGDGSGTNTNPTATLDNLSYALTLQLQR